MSKPILLYSANTYFSYWIAKKYYGNVHWVWCSPFFDSGSVAGYEYTNPPSSCPRKIYQIYADAARNSDNNCARIEVNKVGLIHGAMEKKKAGVITDEQRQEILSTIDQIEVSHFRPLLYVIPYTLVANIVKEVSVQNRANSLSIEYVIEELHRDLFDIIAFD